VKIVGRDSEKCRPVVCRGVNQREGVRERQLAEQRHQGPASAGALGEARSYGTVIMGLIRKAASILTFGSVSYRSGPEAEAAKAHARAAKAQDELAEVEAKVAQEQAAAIAKALQEDEANQHADLEEVAEEEAEAVPWSRQPPVGGATGSGA
jgi:hypothetical protein